MKKEYTTPVITVTVINEEDVIMLSGLTKNTGVQQKLGSLTVDF